MATVFRSEWNGKGLKGWAVKKGIPLAEARNCIAEWVERNIEKGFAVVHEAEWTSYIQHVEKGIFVLYTIVE